MSRKTVAIDFDGVLHKYISPWTELTEIRDPPVAGAFEAIEAYLDAGLEVVVFSTRCRSQEGMGAMTRWFLAHGMFRDTLQALRFEYEKPMALLYIDDRGYCFQGTFPTPEDVLTFKTWKSGDVVPRQEAPAPALVVSTPGGSNPFFDIGEQYLPRRLNLPKELSAWEQSILSGLGVPPEFLEGQRNFSMGCRVAGVYQEGNNTYAFGEPEYVGAMTPPQQLMVTKKAPPSESGSKTCGGCFSYCPEGLTDGLCATCGVQRREAAEARTWCDQLPPPGVSPVRACDGCAQIARRRWSFTRGGSDRPQQLCETCLQNAVTVTADVPRTELRIGGHTIGVVTGVRLAPNERGLVKEFCALRAAIADAPLAPNRPVFAEDFDE